LETIIIIIWNNISGINNIINIYLNLLM